MRDEQIAPIEAEFEAADYILDLDEFEDGQWAATYRHRDSAIGTRIPHVARTKLDAAEVALAAFRAEQPRRAR